MTVHPDPGTAFSAVNAHKAFRPRGTADASTGGRA